MNTSHIGLDSVATHSFESNASEEEGMVTDIIHRMRAVQDYIEHMDSVDEDNGYADGYDSQGEMSTLIQRLANAAESLRTL